MGWGGVGWGGAGGAIDTVNAATPLVIVAVVVLFVVVVVVVVVVVSVVAVVVVLVVVVVVAAAVVVALLFIDACRSRHVLSIRGLMALWALGWSYVPPRPYPQAWAPVTTEMHATKAKTKTKGGNKMKRETAEAGNRKQVFRL